MQNLDHLNGGALALCFDVSNKNSVFNMDVSPLLLSHNNFIELSNEYKFTYVPRLVCGEKRVF